MSVVGSIGAVRAWLDRAGRKVARDDVLALLTPWLVARFAWWVFGPRQHPAADDPAARDPELVAVFVDLMRAFGERWFRLEVRGVENVPATGPALLVGNHNGGLQPFDTLFTMVAICDRFGPERALYMLGHDFIFDDVRMRPYAQGLGGLRAGHGGAHKALRLGGLVIVYPGSDLDTFRPWRDRGKIVLGGRKGFVELALRERVPIVPVVSVGTHEQFIVLTRGDLLAKIIPMHRLARVDVLPIVLSVPWGLTFGFVPYLPLPAQTTLSFGPPIAWPELPPSAADDPVVVERCYREVERAMQERLSGLMKGRRAILGPRKTRKEESERGTQSGR